MKPAAGWEKTCSVFIFRGVMKDGYEHGRQERGVSMKGKGNYLVIALVLLLFVLPLVVDSNYILSVLIIMGLYTIVVQGLGILMGYAGQVSLGHAAFFGLGAYSVAVLTTRLSWPEVFALLGAAVVPGIIAAVIGRPTLKLRELYLAMGTLGFGLLVHIGFNEAHSLTGGPSGMSGIPYLTLGPLVLDTDFKFYYLVWAVVLLVMLVIKNLTASRTGRALRAVSESEYAAESVGIDTAGLKLKAMVFSAVLAGLAGGLYAYYVTFVSPATFGFHASVQFVLMAVVGGPGTLAGPAAGAALVVALGEFLRWLIPLIIPGAGGEYEIIFFGLILAVVMVLCPRGLGTISSYFPRFSGEGSTKPAGVLPDITDKGGIP
ncbi:MAG: branched-chain amino acid ABC transporter permease [Bacillota bacterium]|jgi:branched-chain amino acid transport system permease protein